MIGNDQISLLKEQGFCIIRGGASRGEIAGVLHNLLAAGKSKEAPGIQIREVAMELYEESYWQAISLALREYGSSILGSSAVNDVGRQLVKTCDEPPGTTPYHDVHIDTVNQSLVQAADGGEPVFPRFQILAGVYLTDMKTENSGALWVWPGGHLRFQQFLSAKQSLRENLHTFDIARCIEGISPVCLTGAAGDVVLVHSLLPHAAGRNTTTQVSGRLYIRLARKDVPWWKGCREGDIWSGWNAQPLQRIQPSLISNRTTVEPTNDRILRQERSLFTLDESCLHSELLKRYVLFKLGDVATRQAFLTELAERVATSIPCPPAQEIQYWAIATAATNEVAFDFADALARAWKLSQPLSVLAVSTPARPGTDYTDKTFEERRTIAKDFYHWSSSSMAKNVIIIDDMITTGTALATLLDFLVDHGIESQRIYPYALVRSYLSSPSREREITDETILSMTPTAIAAILNDSRYYVTSGTMFRHLSASKAERVGEIINRLTPRSISLLRNHAIAYFGSLPTFLGSSCEAVENAA